MLYVYPETFPTEVLDLCRDDPRFLPYFDIPMQHASRKVLSRMGRPGSGERYLDLIRCIRRAVPSAVIRTSFLVGFIGEGEKEFAELLRFQREAELDWAGTFTYSVEEGTPAYAYRDEVPPAEVAAHRKEVVDVAQEEITACRLDAYVGRKLDLLVEERVEGENLALARAYAHAPEVDGAVVLHTGGEEAEGGRIQPGAVVPGVVLRRNGIDLEARPAD
jgi:ribosomal protein S12 methylthiotransferase